LEMLIETLINVPYSYKNIFKKSSSSRETFAVAPGNPNVVQPPFHYRSIDQF